MPFTKSTCTKFKNNDEHVRNQDPKHGIFRRPTSCTYDIQTIRNANI